MSSDIEKLATFDGRIIQRRPAYAVQKGALSVTNAPFNAIAQTTSQHTYNIYVPSENVFVDRALTWSSTCTLAVSVTYPGGVPAAGQPLFVPGRDFSLAAFPLNSLCSTMSATINDTTAVINTQDVLYQVLRLADQKRNRMQRTCPTMLDKYQNYDDAYLTINNPLAAYDVQPSYEEAPNGAFQNLWFVDSAGTPLAGTGTSPQAVAVPAGSAAYNAIQGIPISTGAAGTYIFNVQFRSTEKLVLSPFVFADEHEYDTGLFGINNIQLIMNLLSSPARVLRSTSRAGALVGSVAYTSGSGATAPFQNSRINVQFLTPSLDVPLPPKSVVPYMEFPRYLSQAQSIPAGATAQLQSQTITLPQIPDLLIIYARKADAYGTNEADWLFPVATSQAGVGAANVPVNDFSPISINFDNFSGLLSSVTTAQLYEMSVRNGLEMDWDTWSGRAHTASAGYGAGTAGQVVAGQRIPLVGGPLVLKPGQDVTLQAGQSPSLVGNFTLQFNLSVTNNTAAAANAQLVVITANSGFFESIRGSSRIIKGVLSEQDIISAPMAPMGSPQLERLVGGFSFSSLANVLSKAKSVYERTKPVISAIKGALPEEGMAGKVRGALGAVGYGSVGVSAGAMSGGRKHRSLAERLRE